MDAFYALERREGIFYYAAHLVYQRVVDLDRVHVDDEFDVERFLYETLDVVDHVVAFHQVAVSIHLDVYRCEYLAGSVVVDHQVMHTEYSRLAFYSFSDSPDERFIGCLAEQRAGRFLYELYP